MSATAKLYLYFPFPPTVMLDRKYPNLSCEILLSFRLVYWRLKYQRMVMVASLPPLHVLFVFDTRPAADLGLD
jgi:hypothetical protein